MRRFTDWAWIVVLPLASLVTGEKIYHNAPLDWIDKLWLLSCFVLLLIHGLRDVVYRR